MDERLLRPQFAALPQEERQALMQGLADRYGLEFQGLRTFSRWGQRCVTGIFAQSGREFVFVPGDAVTLGWQEFALGMDEANREELRQVLQECNYPGSEEEFLRESMAPVRQAEIAPLLAGRELEEIGWEPISFQDPRLQERPDWLEELQRQTRSGVVSFNLVGQVRFDRIDGQWQAFLSHEISYPQLKEQLRRQGFCLPTADEWAYLCGGGSRALFPWGDRIDRSMTLRYRKKPNFFGLSIAYDPYQMEVVEAKSLTTCGGDGGCNICGGAGPLLGVLPCSPHCRPETAHEDWLDNDFHVCRPIIRVE